MKKKQIIRLTESDIHQIIKETVSTVLHESHIQNITQSENFLRWFGNSKMIDEDGNPLVVGHATRCFGFNKFQTHFIHLSSVDDASYFSGNNKRMLKYKKNIKSFDNDSLIELCNRYFYNSKYNRDREKTDGFFYLKDKYQFLLDKLTDELEEFETDDIKRGFFGEEGEMKIKHNINLLKHLYSKNKTTPIFVNYKDEMWTAKFNDFLNCFFTRNQLIKKLTDEMFQKDNYMGNGGTYAFFCKMEKPFYIECNGNSWDSITIKPNNPHYNELFDAIRSDRYDLHVGSHFSIDNETIAIIAQNLGYDGCVFHNIREGCVGNGILMDYTYIVFSSNQLKSVYENNGDFNDIDDFFK